MPALTAGGERIIRHIDWPARLSILEMLLFAGDDRFGALGISVSAGQYMPRQLGPYPQLQDLARLAMPSGCKDRHFFKQPAAQD